MSIDSNLPRKDRMVSDHIQIVNGVPLFSLIEFNITNFCNRVCSFCPRYYKDKYPNTNNQMTLELYEKIMQDLNQIGYKGVLLFSAFGEPLLYGNLESIIKLSKKYCPNSHVEIITNGDSATDEVVRDLFSYGLDTLLFSLYDGEHQIDEVNKLKEDLGLTSKQIKYRIRYDLSQIILSNRAGLIDIDGINKIEKPLDRGCLYPFYQITIDWDGSVLVCPHDWSKNPTVGNLSKENILDIWKSDKFNEVRLSLIDNDRDFIPCRECNVDGMLMGYKNYNLWKLYYERIKE